MQREHVICLTGGTLGFWLFLWWCGRDFSFEKIIKNILFHPTSNGPTAHRCNFMSFSEKNINLGPLFPLYSVFIWTHDAIFEADADTDIREQENPDISPNIIHSNIR